MSKLKVWAEEKFGKDRVAKIMNEIISTLPQQNTKIKNLKFAQDRTLARLQSLSKGDWNIEYIVVGSQIIEYALKQIIRDHEFYINSSLILGDFNTTLKVTAYIDGTDKTLGVLIKELQRFCKNEPLFGKLGNFNGFRKKAAHQLYDENEDIDLVNMELREYVKTDPVSEIISELSNVHGEIVKSFIDKIEDFGAEKIGPPQFS